MDGIIGGLLSVSVEGVYWLLDSSSKIIIVSAFSLGKEKKSKLSTGFDFSVELFFLRSSGLGKLVRIYLYGAGFF